MANAREAALFALEHFRKTGEYLEAYFEKIAKPLSDRDKRLAKELAFGTMRMQRLLDDLGERSSNRGKLKLKPKEKWVLRLALYEKYFLRTPSFASVHSFVNIAKKECGSSFASFLNALLRKEILPFSNKRAIRYSYPDFFCDLIDPLRDDVLQAMNKTPLLMAHAFDEAGEKKWISKNPPVFLIEGPLEEIVKDPSCYIQNITPVVLLDEMLNRLKTPPSSILDLAASPGGKLIHAAKRFPNARLIANEPSLKRLEVLKENAKKYAITPDFTSFDGREFPADHTFDLVILDAPCSNSGVFNKRPEARWRFSQDTLKAHVLLQGELLKRSLDLIHKGGAVFYSTCSIVPEENEGVVKRAVEKMGATLQYSKTIYPNVKGWDGGYGAVITR